MSKLFQRSLKAHRSDPDDEKVAALKAEQAMEQQVKDALAAEMAAKKADLQAQFEREYRAKKDKMIADLQLQRMAEKEQQELAAKAAKAAAEKAAAEKAAQAEAEKAAAEKAAADEKAAALAKAEDELRAQMEAEMNAKLLKDMMDLDAEALATAAPAPEQPLLETEAADPGAIEGATGQESDEVEAEEVAEVTVPPWVHEIILVGSLVGPLGAIFLGIYSVLGGGLLQFI